MSPPVPCSGILGISPYVGGEASAGGVARVIKLASNEGALGPSPRAVEAYRNEALNLHRYPDGSSWSLRHTIARTHGLNPERIVCGAGSDELMALLANAYADEGTEVLYSRHGFLVYDIVARVAGATPVMVPDQNLTADVDALLAAVTDRTRIVFLANPNNPTGTYLPRTEVERLHAGLPERVLLVLDAAYAEYMDEEDYAAGQDLVERTSNVVMTRTFSKIYALGGLRLGWAYGPAAVIDVLNRVRSPFNVNRAAQAAGVASLEDTEFFAQSRQHNRVWRQWLTDRLRGVGYEVRPSCTNFLLVSFDGLPDDRCNAEAARLALKSQGILVRQMNAYGLPNCLRLSIGTKDEMPVVADAFAAWLEART